MSAHAYLIWRQKPRKPECIIRLSQLILSRECSMNFILKVIPIIKTVPKWNSPLSFSVWWLVPSGCCSQGCYCYLSHLLAALSVCLDTFPTPIYWQWVYWLIHFDWVTNWNDWLSEVSPYWLITWLVDQLLILSFYAESNSFVQTQYI